MSGNRRQARLRWTGEGLAFRGECPAVCAGQQARLEEHASTVNLVAVKHLPGARLAIAVLIEDLGVLVLVVLLFEILEGTAHAEPGRLSFEDKNVAV